MKPRFRERVRNREALAVRADADLLSLCCEVAPPNEDIGDGMHVVYIRGPLEHHACGYADSYEALRARFGAALEAKPKIVLLRIDSPGGAVSGLNETVRDMFTAAQNNGVRVITYVDELAASAAYALACVAEEIYVPPSGIAGSVGVISTMCDQTAADEMAGLRYVTITSGARKADGHVHVSISDEAIAAEEQRVGELAEQFFALVEKARGIDARPLQANIYLAADAVSVGLADGVMGWHELTHALREQLRGGPVESPPPLKRVDTVQAKSVVHTRKALAGKKSSVTQSNPETNMIKLAALISTTRAQLAGEKDASKRVALRAQLDAFNSTLAALAGKDSPYPAKSSYEDEEEEGNETDREEDDMPDDEPKKDEKKSKKSARKSERMEEEGDEPKDEEEEEEEEEAGEGEEDEEEEEEEEEAEEEAKALRSLLGGLRGTARAKALGKLSALVAKAKRADAMAADVAALKRAERQREKESLIAKKLAGGYVTKKTAADLRGKPLAFVKSFLAMQTTKLYTRAGEELVAPMPGAQPGAFSPEQERMFAQAAAASKGAISVEQLKANFVAGKSGGLTPRY